MELVLEGLSFLHHRDQFRRRHRGLEVWDFSSCRKFWKMNSKQGALLFEDEHEFSWGEGGGGGLFW